MPIVSALVLLDDDATVDFLAVERVTGPLPELLDAVLAATAVVFTAALAEDVAEPLLEVETAAELVLAEPFDAVLLPLVVDLDLVADFVDFVTSIFPIFAAGPLDTVPAAGFFVSPAATDTTLLVPELPADDLSDILEPPVDTTAAAGTAVIGLTFPGVEEEVLDADLDGTELDLFTASACAELTFVAERG